MEFRLAKKSDAKRLLEIYKPYVEKTAITFEYEVPTIAEFEKRIEKIGSRYPYICLLYTSRMISVRYFRSVSVKSTLFLALVRMTVSIS